MARRLWTATLAGALLVTGAGLGVLYVDDTNVQGANRALTSQNESLTGQNENLQSDLSTTKDSLAQTQAQLTTAQAALLHPNLEIWNVKQTLSDPTHYLAAGVPDTFTYHLELTSTGPVSVSILSFSQFSAAVRCVETGAGSTNYCMHHNGSAQSWIGVTSVSFDFHLSEGCAAYMVVITTGTSSTVTPNVSVTYNPASTATGACA